jgi:uncharacterized protein (DUF1499 family)
LSTLVAQTAGAKIAQQSPEYLHAEFRTPWLGFVDDVEFFADRSAGCIHVRSASRLGYSDLGTNRRRLERLKQEFLALLKVLSK